jgi:hypothetical protein
MAANNLLKIQLHSIAREKLVALKQFPSLPFHYAEFSNANYLRPLNMNQIRSKKGLNTGVYVSIFYIKFVRLINFINNIELPANGKPARTKTQGTFS